MNRQLLICCTLLAASCASVQVTPLNRTDRPMTPRAPDDVKLYVTRAPEVSYDEVFLIRSDAATSENALNAMRERAGELGCDGLVIAGSANRVVSTGDGGGGSTVSTREGFVGSCVMFHGS